jgi:hypothetical protein
MSNFTTRVELHHPVGVQDYETLHAAMEQAGFSRTIRGDNGVWYHMPYAEYDYSGSASADQVRAAAVLAAGRTGRTFAVLVTESQRRAWQGLAPV